MNKRPVWEWKEEIIPVLHSKKNEFELLGYSKISTEEIWNCLVEYVWKGNPEKQLYEIVQSVFQLQIHSYMDYLALNTLQNENELMSSIQAVLNRE